MCKLHHHLGGTCAKIESDSNYLPNLNNEKTGEQIVFELKVKRSNESFSQKVDDFIKWLASPLDCQVHPKKCFHK